MNRDMQSVMRDTEASQSVQMPKPKVPRMYPFAGRKALNKYEALDAMIDKCEKGKADMRDNLGHTFQVIKLQLVC